MPFVIMIVATDLAPIECWVSSVIDFVLQPQSCCANAIQPQINDKYDHSLRRRRKVANHLSAF